MKITTYFLNLDVEIRCSHCGSIYLLLNRDVTGDPGYSEKLMREKIPLWQRCHRCGLLSDEGVRQARLKRANFMFTFHPTPDGNARTLKRFAFACGLAIPLLVLTGLLTGESELFLALTYLPVAGLVIGVLPTVLLHRFYVKTWDPNSPEKVDEWKNWWSREGRGQFTLTSSDRYGEWKPEIY
ncbi:hypothetical protein KKA85_01745 [bacterium]|nr:hypothetical protein [bacterium]MBU1674483.1 hypothetical protein [bacterium]